MTSSIRHHLGGRTHFSIGESTLSPKRLVELAQAADHESVALVDTMSVSGMIELVRTADKLKIKSIVGCRLRVVQDPLYRNPPKRSGERPKDNPTFYPKVYVKNADGLKDLVELLSIGFQADHFYYVPRIGRHELLATFARGNLALSTGDFYSVFHLEDASETVSDLRRSHIDSDVFVELCPIATPVFDTLNERAILAAQTLDLPLILTYPALYASADDADALETLGAIATNTKMDSRWRPHQYVRDFEVLPTQDIMSRALNANRRLNDLGVDSKGAWANAALGNRLLASRCEYHWEKLPACMPVMAKSEFNALAELCKVGWKERLSEETLGYKPDRSQWPVYAERLRFELDVLRRMKFERYFLLVSDLVRHAKKSGIIVGPGRGSVGGSLVAYLTGITDVDPIRFGLLFERFINPDRLDLPDADLDFMSSRRHEIVDYLIGRHGAENVAGISNYTTMASSSALRDVGRVFGLSQMELLPSRYVPKEMGKSASLTEAADSVAELAKFRTEHPTVWELATRLEGKMRSIGQHAAGVIVAGEPIIKRAVVSTRDGAKLPTVNWDRNSVEDFGLVKIDILGLSTLDMLSDAAEYIRLHEGIEIDYLKLPLNDPKVLSAFGEGRTIGVFQFDSGGMSNLLKNLAMGGDLTFDELVAATALYRPGPMQSGMMDDYIAIRQGVKDVTYEHPNMEAALKDTNGILIFQESVMRLAVDLAGFTLAEADKLRKIMGKKQPDLMAEQRDHWIKGCVDTSGMAEHVAEAIFNDVEKFAGYGFNKSHSVEYSILSYWAMYLKVHHTPYFYAATLGITDQEDKLPRLIRDASEHKVLVAPPDINRSGLKFSVVTDESTGVSTLYAPFNKIKGFTDKSAGAILDARREGPFVSTPDFLKRVNKTKVNKRHQETLEVIGALASITPGAPPANHPSRLKDQMTLLPGVMQGMVSAERKLTIDKASKGQIVKLVNDFRTCKACSLCEGAHPIPRMGKTPKFFVVTDAPNWGEAKAGKNMEGDASKYLKKAIKAAGLDINDGYYTSLVKAPKEGKVLTAAQINACSVFLERELEILKPAVVLALGGGAIRHLVPDVKGGFADLAGQVHYLPKSDMSVVFGINPMMIWMDSAKQSMLDDALEKVATIVKGL